MTAHTGYRVNCRANIFKLILACDFKDYPSMRSSHPKKTIQWLSSALFSLPRKLVQISRYLQLKRIVNKAPESCQITIPTSTHFRNIYPSAPSGELITWRQGSIMYYYLHVTRAVNYTIARKKTITFNSILKNKNKEF